MRPASRPRSSTRSGSPCSRSGSGAPGPAPWRRSAAGCPRRAGRGWRGCSARSAASPAAREQRQRRAPELDAISVTRVGSRLAGAQVERHAGPAPRVDRQLQRHVRLGLRVRRDLVLVAVADELLAPPPSRTRTGREPSPPPPRSGVIGFTARSTLSFSSRRSSALNSTGGSMREDGHAAAGTWFWTMSRIAPVCVVELAAPLHAHRLRHGDLHAVDVAPIPDRLEQAVAEAEDGEVLDRLLAQVVVDAKDLVLVEDGADLAVQAPRARQVVAERLLDDDARPAALRAVDRRSARGPPPRGARRSRDRCSVAPPGRRAGCRPCRGRGRCGRGASPARRRHAGRRGRRGGTRCCG